MILTESENIRLTKNMGSLKVKNKSEYVRQCCYNAIRIIRNGGEQGKQFEETFIKIFLNERENRKGNKVNVPIRMTEEFIENEINDFAFYMNEKYGLNVKPMSVIRIFSIYTKPKIE